jgi:hypothetical protein
MCHKGGMLPLGDEQYTGNKTMIPSITINSQWIRKQSRH